MSGENQDCFTKKGDVICTHQRLAICKVSWMRSSLITELISSQVSVNISTNGNSRTNGENNHTTCTVWIQRPCACTVHQCQVAHGKQFWSVLQSWSTNLLYLLINVLCIHTDYIPSHTYTCICMYSYATTMGWIAHIYSPQSKGKESTVHPRLSEPRLAEPSFIRTHKSL